MKIVATVAITINLESQYKAVMIRRSAKKIFDPKKFEKISKIENCKIV